MADRTTEGDKLSGCTESWLRVAFPVTTLRELIDLVEVSEDIAAEETRGNQPDRHPTRPGEMRDPCRRPTLARLVPPARRWGRGDQSPRTSGRHSPDAVTGARRSDRGARSVRRPTRPAPWRR